MSHCRVNAIVLGTLLFASCIAGSAQEIPPHSGPEQEHAFLKKFVGQWVIKSECMVGPDQPPMESTGRMDARMLGDLWMVNETESSMAETRVTALQTIGYDPQKRKYVGTWVDSVMNYLWSYEGTVEGNTLILETEGPNFSSDGKLAKFHDSYEFKSPDEIAISSSMLTEEGTWMTFMSGTAKRVPASR